MRAAIILTSLLLLAPVAAADYVLKETKTIGPGSSYTTDLLGTNSATIKNTSPPAPHPFIGNRIRIEVWFCAEENHMFVLATMDWGSASIVARGTCSVELHYTVNGGGNTTSVSHEPIAGHGGSCVDVSFPAGTHSVSTDSSAATQSSTTTNGTTNVVTTGY